MPPTEWKDISNWRVALLRFTAFFELNSELDIRSILADILSGEPEDIRETPKEFRTVYEYNHGEHSYSATKRPGRLDLLCGTPHQNFLSGNNDFPSIGPLEEVYADFDSICVAIISTSIGAEATRVAFGSVNDLPMDNRTTGYELLSEMVNIPLDPHNSGDFQYRINRYKSTTVDDESVKINNIATWFFAEQTIKEEAKQGSAADLERKVLSCRLDLDISTAEDYRGTINGPLYSEFFAIAKKLCVEGDVP